MSEPFSKCPCDHCGGNIEFPSASAGMRISCPHCGSATVLRSGRSKRVFKILTLIAVCFVIAGGAVAFRLKQTKLVENSADKASANSETPALPKPKIINEFRIGQVKIENMGENGLVYCLGTARNLSKEQRFGVKIELELHNSQGEAIGQTSDYISVLEPEAEWNFKALVTESQATSAIVLNITETQ